MKSTPLIICFIMLVSCDLENVEPFETYRISEGTHGKFGRVQSLIADEVRFVAVFDESAIYKSQLEENQHDVNKLIGFSDCNSHHHEHSARFGWRWLDDQLEILAYCYVSGNRIVETLGTVPLNSENNYSIRLEDNGYVFQLNDYPEVVVQRERPCNKGLYYMLWPYFGGDETAPHDITIKVQLKF